MAENVTVKQTTGLQQAVVFSVALDESVDVNDVARLALVARYCDNDRVYEELCCLIPLGGTVKGVDIITALVSYFENQNINIKITSSVYDCTVEDVEYIYNKLSIHIFNSKSRRYLNVGITFP